MVAQNSYCLICGGPDHFNNDNFAIAVSRDYLEDNEVTDGVIFVEEAEKLFGWLNAGAALDTHGHLFIGHPDWEGSFKVDNGNEFAISNFFVDDDLVGSYFWTVIYIHKVCQEITGLGSVNDFNRLFFSRIYNDSFENVMDDPEFPGLTEYHQEEFPWEDVLQPETLNLRWMLEDPAINARNRARIQRRGEVIRALPLTPGEFPTIHPPRLTTISVATLSIQLNVVQCYTVEMILDLDAATIRTFGADFRQPNIDVINILRILKHNGLLVGPHRDLIDNPAFPGLLQKSYEELKHLHPEGFRHARLFNTIGIIEAVLAEI